MNTSVINTLNKVQKKAQNAILYALKNEGRALNVMATGTGKTHVAAELIHKILKIEPKARFLWVTHTTELRTQTELKLEQKLKNVSIGRFDSEGKEFDAQILVATIQTLSRKNHLKKFKRNHFHYIFNDEAHHTPSDTWKRVIEYFAGAKRYGFTATPIRPDDRPGEFKVVELFGEPVFELPFSEAQRLGILAKDEGYIILTNSVLSNVKTNNGEYSPMELDKLYVSKDRNKIIVKSYLKYGRKTMRRLGLKPKSICFCISVQHAHVMKQLFNKNGVKAEFIVGDGDVQTKEERATIWSKFKETNEIEMLCAVNVLNEGLDVDDVGCVLMCRPTRSNIIYQQQVGRGARAISKKKFVVLDFVDNVRHDWQMYTINNLTKRKLKRSRIVYEYLTVKDRVIVEDRVDSVIKGVEEWQNRLRETPEEKKKQLIELAKSGAPKPTKAHPLGAALYDYTKGNARDLKFISAIRKINPLWLDSKRWTLEKIISEAKKYTKKIDFRNKSWGAYVAARRRGILDEICRHMKKSNRGISDKEIFDIFKSVSSASELYKRYGKNIYYLAKKRGLYNKFSKHFKRLHPSDYVGNRRAVICLDRGIVFSSMKEAAKYCGINSSHMTRSIKEGHSFGNYRWAYYDPKKHAHLVKKTKKKRSIKRRTVKAKRTRRNVIPFPSRSTVKKAS